MTRMLIDLFCQMLTPFEKIFEASHYGVASISSFINVTLISKDVRIFPLCCYVRTNRNPEMIQMFECVSRVLNVTIKNLKHSCSF